MLAAAGIVLSLLYTGSAISTTAIGTLLPILSDTGELRTRLGTYLLAAGAVGEFGPVLLLTLLLTTQTAVHNAIILTAFVAAAVTVAVLAVRSSEDTVPLFERTIEKSSQLAVRWIVVLVFALALLASEFGLDLLLGGFAAGLITRQVLREHEVPGFDSKLTGVAFGVFIPIFFVVSGMQLDVDALFASASGVATRVLLRAVPRSPGHTALLLYRGVLDTASASSWPCSRPRSCHWCSRSRPWRLRRATVTPRRRPRSWARRRCRRSSIRSLRCGSGGGRPRARRRWPRRRRRDRDGGAAPVSGAYRVRRPARSRHGRPRG